MNANDVLIDLLDDNRRRLRRTVGQMNAECLHWSPEPGANNIAVTVWHMGRLFDLLLTQFVKGEGADHECWFSRGWAETTGYDPRGVGRDGWGTGNDYTPEEVAAIPRLSADQLLAYIDDVYDTVKTYLGCRSIDELQVAAAGFEGEYSRYQCIQMALMDNVRHLGEIYTIKAMWDRKQ